MPSELIVMPDGTGVAGLIVFWELTGIVDYEDLRDTWLAAGFDEKLLPPRTTMEVALGRSAVACLNGKRQLCRPLTKRGSWEIVYEQVTVDDDLNETLVYKPIVQGYAIAGKLPSTGESFKSPVVRVIDEQHGVSLREQILAKVPFYERTMLSVDVSSWLLGLLGSSLLHAVPLRHAGGFYFIPTDKVDLWREIVRCVQAVGSNVLHEIPAMKTDSAIEAILSQVRAEAEARLNAMADYLKGDVSTKGLNATERDAAFVRQKLQNYIDTLGIALPELTNWCEQIHGAVQAAHMIRVADKEKAA